VSLATRALWIFIFAELPRHGKRCRCDQMLHLKLTFNTQRNTNVHLISIIIRHCQ